ncbi:hypothetical protein D3C76_1452430 [compost metagenome]
MMSLPAPPLSSLATALPISRSLPEPPKAFSTVTPLAMEILPIMPPTSENEASLRLIFWFWVNPEKSRVSLPPPSHTENTTFDEDEVAE